MKIYFFYCYLVFFLSLGSIIFIVDSILSVLICAEAMILGVFCICLIVFSMESFMELLLFLTVVVGESILGLVLMVLKVGLSGSDFFDLGNVV